MRRKGGKKRLILMNPFFLFSPSLFLILDYYISLFFHFLLGFSLQGRVSLWPSQCSPTLPRWPRTSEPLKLQWMVHESHDVSVTHPPLHILYSWSPTGFNFGVLLIFHLYWATRTFSALRQKRRYQKVSKWASTGSIQWSISLYTGSLYFPVSSISSD